jgi:hypothetical protein
MTSKSSTKPKRPRLTRTIDPDDLRKYYWLKAELAQFCQQLGIPGSGRKLDILNRIEVLLRTGKTIKPERIVLGANSADGLPRGFGRRLSNAGVLTLKTSVVNFKSDQRTREFFESVIGQHFHFTAHLNQFMRGRSDLTYGDLVKEWLAERELRKDKSYKPPIMKSCEYNQYIRDYFADPMNRGKSLKDAIGSWNRAKRQAGPRVYSAPRHRK